MWFTASLSSSITVNINAFGQTLRFEHIYLRSGNQYCSAGSRYRLIRFFAAGHGCPAALLDEGVALVTTIDLCPTGQIRHSVRRDIPKTLDAYQRPSRHDRGFGSIYGSSLGGSTRNPAAPCEPDDDSGDCAAGNSPYGRFHFRRKFYFVRLPIFEEEREFFRLPEICQIRALP